MSRPGFRRDSTSTSPSSPSQSIDSSSSSLDSSQGNKLPRVSVSHHDGAGAVRDEVPLFHGEKVEAVYQDIAYLCPFNNPNTIRGKGPTQFIKCFHKVLSAGTLTVTNYRLYFRPHQKEHPVILDIPLGFVARVDKVGGARTPGDNYGLDISCKDLRNLRLVASKY